MKKIICNRCGSSEFEPFTYQYKGGNTKFDYMVRCKVCKRGTLKVKKSVFLQFSRLSTQNLTSFK